MKATSTTGHGRTFATTRARLRSLALGTALAVGVGSAAYAAPAPAAMPPSSAASSPDDGLPRDPLPPGALALPEGYDTRVDANLRKRTDSWGEQLMALPNGPTLDNVRPLLTPANHSGGSLAKSPWYYLPLTYPAPDLSTWAAERAFSLHVGDGSEIQSQWTADPNGQTVIFNVGKDGAERFGSAEARLATPTLAEGYLPILGNAYTDADGVRYTRESFATRLTEDGELVSLVKLTAQARRPGVSTVKLGLQVAGSPTGAMTGDAHSVRLGDKVVLASSAAGTWSGSTFTAEVPVSNRATEVYVLVANTPAPLGDAVPTAAVYAERRAAMSTYWRELVSGGAKVSVPEPYAVDAMRSTLLNNLVMGFNLTVGNGYEEQETWFAFVPEVIATLTSLGDYGYDARTKETLEEFLKRGQGGFFVTWERGIKLQAAARHYLQTGDESVIRANLSTFTSWLDDFHAQRANDPHGLLAKTRYASDITTPVYGIHHQSDAWRGLRDMGVALDKMTMGDDATAFTAEATALRTSILAAIDASKTELPDGSVFVPIGLLSDEDDTPYDSVTDSFLGSYWNLIMPYAMGSGLIEPGSELAAGMEKYLNQHGALLLGLTRFNLTGDPVGSCVTAGSGWPAVPGYRSTGIDQQYGYSYAKFLSDNGQADRLNMSFYGMLAHNFSPNTFIAGEGATVSPCGQEYHRSQYWAPLSPNNATYLKALRGMLVHERLDGDGRPVALDIAPATARSWLASGKEVSAKGLPTLFGPVDFSITSSLARREITATVTRPSGRPASQDLQEIRVHLRAPAGHSLRSATVNGRAASVDRARSIVTLPGSTTTAKIKAQFVRTPVRPVLTAIAATASLADRVVVAGGRTELTSLVELSGTSAIIARVSYEVPAGWKAPSTRLVSAWSGGSITWRDTRATVQVPATATSGTYPVDVVVTDPQGRRTRQTVQLEVAESVPDGTYADVVLAESPVGYWPLDDDGTTSRDASGEGNDGTMIGTVRTGQPGPVQGTGSVRLAGGYVDVPDSPSLSVTGPYTLEAWTFSRGGGEQAVVEKYDAPARNGYLLRLATDHSLATRGYTRLQAMNLSDTLSATPPSGGALAPDQWHHLVSVFDGSALTIYRDGQEVSRTPMTRVPTDGAGSLKIGARGDDGATRFDGWMSNVAVYDKALSAETVKEHYVKGMVRPRR